MKGLRKYLTPFAPDQSGAVLDQRRFAGMVCIMYHGILFIVSIYLQITV